MRVYGYARVSTDDQNTAAQVDALTAAGCDLVKEEKESGATIEGRPVLKTLLEFMQAGDTLVVTKLDRLARNTLNMLEIIETLGRHQIGFRSLAEPWADTTTPAGRLMLTVMAGVAAFERERIKERQKEGIARAKEAGAYTGGKRKHDPQQIKDLKSSGLSHSAICAKLACSEETVRRALKAQ